MNGRRHKREQYIKMQHKENAMSVVGRFTTMAWVVVFFGLSVVRIGPTAFAESPDPTYSAEILETKILARSPGRYIGWPSVVQAANGDLVVVFSGDRTAHVSPDGKTRLVRSSDGGTNWSRPITIHDSPLDDRDAGILRTKDGTLLVTWFTAAGDSVSKDDRRRWLGNWTMRSTDHGKTWERPVKSHATTPHGGIQLADGRILVLGQFPHESQKVPYHLAIDESPDDGKTWRVVSKFPVPADARMLSYDEPNLIEVEPGRLLALFRDCYGDHPIRQAESSDGDRSWTGLHETPVRGYPPHVIRLRGGRLLMVYGKRWPPYGEYACLSRDGGRTWDVDQEIQLASAPNGDLGYPASVELENGTIWTVYYQVAESGQKPCLMGTHWRIKDDASR